MYMDNPFELILQELRDIKEHLSVAPPGTAITPAEIINEETLCKRLNITLPTASRWRKRNRLPFMQLGSSIRYNWPQVVAVLENKKMR
jgi:hypothetical protein